MLINKQVQITLRTQISLQQNYFLIGVEQESKENLSKLGANEANLESELKGGKSSKSS